MDREKAIKLVKKVGSDLKGYKVILFGSRAAGHAGPRSDFDVGIIGDRRFFTLQTLGPQVVD